jgi:hypothetical protein
MKPLGFRGQSLVLIVTLLLCHGVFGSLHLLCYSQQCAGDAEHPAEHHATAGAMDDRFGHPAGHGTSTGYFAVIGSAVIGSAVIGFGFLSLLWGLLPGVTPARLMLDARRPATLRQVPAVVRPPPTSPTLQVFRL